MSTEIERAKWRAAAKRRYVRLKESNSVPVYDIDKEKERVRSKRYRDSVKGRAAARRYRERCKANSDKE